MNTDIEQGLTDIEQSLEDFKNESHSYGITYVQFCCVKYIYLFFKAYWRNTVPEKWELTDFDLSLCKKGLVTKHGAHTLLLADVKLLEDNSSLRVAKNAKCVAVELKVTMYK